ncbi:hypothetical protein K3495_g6790 [Podosphaera aphanis]|nr:hypothetical protein K3495_g6790 [Podosphaera aphanis]
MHLSEDDIVVDSDNEHQPEVRTDSLSDTTTSTASNTISPAARKSLRNSSPKPPANGLADSLNAQPRTQTKSPTPHTLDASRVFSHISSKATNEYAAALTAWQNAGARHLRSLPPAIAADLRAITTRSAARVIAGLPVFDHPPQQDPVIKCSQLSAPRPTSA